jgi:ribosomal protein S18 acetylase RimI-like enzyme
MLRALVATPLRVREATNRFLAYGRAVEAMRAETVPGSHWYLAGIGVEPAVQRHGVGSALLRPGLDAADRAGLPAALLTNSERNLAFYERHGFRVIHEGETPSGGPHAWMMRREPA